MISVMNWHAVTTACSLPAALYQIGEKPPKLSRMQINRWTIYPKTCDTGFKRPLELCSLATEGTQEHALA